MVSTKLRVRELLRERRWTTKVLAEKTGMSESYLTHIKNGTRRWNEDALRKLADAFGMEPASLFSHAAAQKAEISEALILDAVPSADADVKVRVVPVLGEIPSHPNEYNNQIAQLASGYKGVFVPVFNSDEDGTFCLCIEDSTYAPRFMKGDMLVIAPNVWTRSGDIVAVEFGPADATQKDIMQVNYMDEFVVLESVNHKRAPIALVREKNEFRIIGKVVYRYQKMM